MPRAVLLALLVALACTPAKVEPFDALLPAPALAALQSPDQLELLTVVPDWEADAPAPAVHGHRVLGRADIVDEAARRELTAPLIASMRGGLERGPSKCFNPRHALRAVKGAEQVEVLVCFECKDAVVYHRGEQRPTGLDGADAAPAFAAAVARAGRQLATSGGG